jgi:ribose transport system permease protein
MRRWLTDYGMLGVLLILCLLFSILTVAEQHPTGADAAKVLADSGALKVSPTKELLIIAQPTGDDSAFVRELKSLLIDTDEPRVILAGPSDVRAELQKLADQGAVFSAIVTSFTYAPVVNSIKSQFPSLAGVKTIVPPSRKWPTFLLADNIRNVANQITVIAIIAIGMTMVIITAGIDLSVGSLVALSAVCVAWLIGQMGGEGVYGRHRCHNRLWSFRGVQRLHDHPV